jgi:hypothetical protein
MKRATSAAILGMTVGCVGCVNPPPFSTLETASVLPSGGASIMAGAGGGTFTKSSGAEGTDWGGTVAGAVARARYGIGNDQEIGIEGDVLQPSRSDGRTWGLEVRYKRAMSAHVALLAGLGTRLSLHGDTSTLGGADVGAILSTPLGHDLTIYSAARVGVTIPLHSDVFVYGGIGETLAIPIGLVRRFDAHWQGMIEVGGLGQLDEGRFADPMSLNPPPPVTRATSVGGYGVIAISRQL